MRAALAIAIALLMVAPAGAAEIRVLSANALNIPERAIAEDFEKQTGHKVIFTFGSPGLIQERFDKGEPFDLLIMPIAAIEAAEKAGKLKAGTHRKFARVGVGIAVKEGGKMPDLSSADALRKTLLEAKSVTYSDASTGGLSSVSVQKVLTNLGIADAIKAKAKLMAQNESQALIGKGEIELGLFNVSEIPRAPGVVLAGPVPAAVQAYIEYDAALPATAAQAEPALALLAAFQSPAQRARWTKGGLEIPE